MKSRRLLGCFRKPLTVGLLFLCSLAEAGPEAVLLDTPQVSAQARADVVSTAREEVIQVTYIFAPNVSGLVNAAVLWHQALEGKQVYLLIDHFAAGHGRPDPAVLAVLMKAGAHVGYFHPPTWRHPLQYFRRLHDKLVIVDGRHLITGDRNVSNEYFGIDKTPWRGMDVYVQSDEIAASARGYVLAMFNSPHVRPPSIGRVTAVQMDDAAAKLQQAWEAAQAHEILAQREPFAWLKARRVPVDSARLLHFDLKNLHSPGRKAEQTLKAIGSATGSLEIVTPYFAPPKAFELALKDRLAHGVVPKILTNSPRTNNQPLVALYYDALLPLYAKMGLEIWEYQGPESLHAKLFQVDGVHTAIGSFNGDGISFFKNTESGVLITDPEFARVTRDSLETHFYSNAKPVAKDGELLRPSGTCAAALRHLVPLLKNHL